MILVLGSNTGERPTRAPWAPQLMPVANRPLLDHALGALGNAGVASTVVVADSETSSCVQEALADSSIASNAVALLEVPHGHGELGSLRAARAEIGDASLVVHRGDALVGNLLSRELPRFLAGGADAAILVLDPRGRERDEINGGGHGSGDAVPLGIEILAPRMLDALDGVADGCSTGLARLISRARGDCLTVEERVLSRGWRLSGGRDGVLEGNRLALDELEEDWHPDSLERTRIEGRVIVHPTSHIEDALLRGPCLIGPDAVIRHAYIGPYTSIGAGCVIENVEIEHSVIMSGATIRDVGWRLEHSVVGARTVVHRHFHLPKAVQLCVGDDARITVS